MTTKFDELVYSAIANYTVDEAQDLAGILGFVDGKEKLILTHEKLLGSLTRLVDSGRVVEIPNHRFYNRKKTDKRTYFIVISMEAYRSASERYRTDFWKNMTFASC